MLKIQAIIYNSTRDRWYVFRFTTNINDNMFAYPPGVGSPWNWEQIEEHNAIYEFGLAAAQTVDWNFIDQTTTVPGGFPLEWSGQKWFGICFHSER